MCVCDFSHELQHAFLFLVLFSVISAPHSIVDFLQPQGLSPLDTVMILGLNVATLFNTLFTIKVLSVCANMCRLLCMSLCTQKHKNLQQIYHTLMYPIRHHFSGGGFSLLNPNSVHMGST